MSLHAYHVSLLLTQKDVPFEALLMAAMRKADSDNIESLKRAFPSLWLELSRRYQAGLGILPEDEVEDIHHVERLIKQLKI